MKPRPAFAHHRPTPAGAQAIEQLRQGCSDLADLIERLAPASRERSVAITSLETAAMWATKAVVLNDPGSVPAPG